MKDNKTKNEILTKDELYSSSLLDDPNNFLSDDLFEFLKEDYLDLESREKLQNEFQKENEKDVEQITKFKPQLNELTQHEDDFDVYEYFAVYNELYFDGKLGCVILEWSKRMTTCAGIFYTKLNEYIIRLSEPLLKFRTIKEIKETLLHEMIHAWVQIENLDQSDDKGGHGYNFKLKMYEINKNTGFNITVYHTFHDEVDFYKTHVWRCNGVCRNKHPYYGYVKRAMNRAPGKNDLWWEDHNKKCGGEFIKIGEPEKKIKSQKENKKFKSISKVDNNNNSNNILRKIKIINIVNEDNKLKKTQEKAHFIETESIPKNKYKKIDDFFKLNSNKKN